MEEFLKFAIEQNPNKEQADFFKKFLSFQLTSDTTCNTCDYSTSIDQSKTYIKIRRKIGIEDKFTVKELVEKFFSEKNVSCEKCHNYSSATEQKKLKGKFLFASNYNYT